MRNRHRHKDVAKVTRPMRAVEPYVARAQRVAQVEHDRDFPEVGIIIALRPQLSPPFGMRSQEIVGRRNCALGSDGGSRVQQKPCNRRSFEVEASQHARDLPTDAVIPLINIGQRIVARSEEHTYELQSLMRIAYAVIGLKKKKIKREQNSRT